MAYTFLQVGISMSFGSECGLTGQSRVDLLSVPADQAGHLMPHAQSAGATLLPTRPISRKRLPAWVARVFSGRVDLYMPSCFRCSQMFAMLISRDLSIAPAGISPCSR